MARCREDRPCGASSDDRERGLNVPTPAQADSPTMLRSQPAADHSYILSIAVRESLSTPGCFPQGVFLYGTLIDAAG